MKNVFKSYNNRLLDINIALLIFILFFGTIMSWNNKVVYIYLFLNIVIFFKNKFCINLKDLYILILTGILLCLNILSFDNVGIELKLSFCIYYVFFIITFINLKNYFNAKENIIKFIEIFSICINILMILSIVEYFLHYNPFFSYMFKENFREIYSNDRVGSLYRISSSFGNPLVAGNIFIIGYMLNIYEFYIKKSFKNSIKIFISIVSLLLTLNKSTYVIAIIGTIIWWLILLFKRKKEKIKLKNIILYLSIIFFIIGGIKYIINNTNFGRDIVIRFSNLDNQISINQRNDRLNYVINKMKDDTLEIIIGHGAGSIKEQMNSDITGLKVIDNQYITFVYENGIIFILGILVLVFYIIKKIIFDKNLLIKIIALILFLLMINLWVYDGFYWYQPNYIIAAFLSILTNLNNMRGKNGIQI